MQWCVRTEGQSDSGSLLHNLRFGATNQDRRAVSNAKAMQLGQRISKTEAIKDRLWLWPNSFALSLDLIKHYKPGFAATLGIWTSVLSLDLCTLNPGFVKTPSCTCCATDHRNFAEDNGCLQCLCKSSVDSFVEARKVRKGGVTVRAEAAEFFGWIAE